ncbi:MAG: Wzy polymerase domain-containing protein [Burkholderiales bacterium]
MNFPVPAAQGPWLRYAAAAVALMAIVPFVLPFHQPPLQSFYQEWIAFLFGSAALALVGLGATDRRIEVPRTTVLPLGLAVLVIVQIILGRITYWQQGVLGMLYLLWACAMLAVGFVLRRGLGWDRFAAVISWALFAGSMATAAMAYARFLGWNTAGWVMPMFLPRLYGNLGQPNHFADYLALGLFSAGFLIVTRRLNTVIGIAASVVLLVGLNLSGSRVVWIYLVAAAALAAWLHLGQRTGESRRLFAWAGAMIVLYVAIQLGAAHLFDANSPSIVVVKRLSEDVSANSDRSRIWYAALLMLKDTPVLGVGFEGFGWHYFEMFSRFPSDLDPGLTDNAHNIVFQLLAEFGLPGGLLLALCVVIWAAGQWRQPLSVQRWWALSLVATIGAHSLLEYPLWYAYFLGVFAVLLGATEEAAWRFHSRALDRIAFAAAALIAVWTLSTILVDYRRVEGLAHMPQNALEADRILSQALSLHRTSLLTHIVELGLVRTIRIDEDQLQAKLELNGRVLRYLPTANVAYRQSALDALAGNLPAAFRQWDLAAACFPGKAAPMIAELRLLASQGQPRLVPLVEYAAARGKE